MAEKDGVVFENRVSGEKKIRPFPRDKEITNMSEARDAGRGVSEPFGCDRVGVRFQGEYESYHS